jgi:hypothetical protein
MHDDDGDDDDEDYDLCKTVLIFYNGSLRNKLYLSWTELAQDRV